VAAKRLAGIEDFLESSSIARLLYENAGEFRQAARITLERFEEAHPPDFSSRIFEEARFEHVQLLHNRPR
jgi:hypothetical protein